MIDGLSGEQSVEENEGRNDCVSVQPLIQGVHQSDVQGVHQSHIQGVHLCAFSCVYFVKLALPRVPLC